jgi:hypothetical protein
MCGDGADDVAGPSVVQEVDALADTPQRVIGLPLASVK